MTNQNDKTGCAFCPERYQQSCQAIVTESIENYWLPKLNKTLPELIKMAGYTNVRIIEKLMSDRQGLPSDFLRSLVHSLGLVAAARANYEDVGGILTDSVCRKLIIDPYIKKE